MAFPISTERIYNIVLGLNVLGWSFAGIFYSTDTELSLVRICISAINALAGILFLIRKKAMWSSNLWNGYSWLPVLFCNGLLFRLSLPLQHWPAYSVYLFVAGTLFALLSLLKLGQNFSIRPSFRTLETKGVYQFVRHPIYFGETIMAFACLLAGQLMYSLPVFLLLLAFQAYRIREEEQLLSKAESFQRYVQQTPWRLVPFVW